jgi:25S rRNA (uracil2634-N3)-methyltransferase
MVKSKKTSLKAALSSTQARLKEKKKAESAATQAFENRGAKAKAKAKTRNPRRSTIPFNVSDNILLIGEGNFSFAVALLRHPPTPLEHLPPANVIATAFDTEEECYAKYPDAEACVRVLREKGAQVLFGIDATKLEKTSALKGRTFDRIVWNFPHAGEYPSTESDGKR